MSRRVPALLAALLLLAGCGGADEEPDSPPTQAEVIAEADEACGELAAWYADNPFPVDDFDAEKADDEQLAEVGDYLARAPVGDLAEQLAALEAPEETADAWASLAERLGVLADTFAQQAEAAERGQQRRFVGLTQTVSFQGSVIGQDVDRLGFAADTEGGCAQVF